MLITLNVAILIMLWMFVYYDWKIKEKNVSN